MGIKSEQTMDLNTFNEHLDRLGAEFENWPQPLRSEAQALVRTSPEAADALADAGTLANLLAAIPEVAARPQLARQISQRAVDPWQRLLDWFSAALWRPVLATSLPLVFGFIIGLMQQAPIPEEDAYLAAEVGLMAFSGSYEALAEEGDAYEN